MDTSGPRARLSAFRPVPRTGVIFVTTEAESRGFSPEDPDWCNLGQGQPETGPLVGAPERILSATIHEYDQDYAPVAGLPDLREAVAKMYNDLFRQGKRSQYTAANVAITGGGRVALMRASAAISPVHLGHFLPDYTAYAELLDVFRRFSPTPILLDPARAYAFNEGDLEREILGRGLGAILMSNPCNPTGKVISGESLGRWVGVARNYDCTLLLDEFYSHYIWTGDEPIISAASHVEDVNEDPILIVDGLTKNWRYPGWRVTWIVGPEPVIEAVASAGSFLDGGGSRPMQRAAIELVTKEHALQETAAIRNTFLKKRNMMVEGLRDLGVRFDLEPEGTFYAWGDLSELPPSLRNGEMFFQAALEEKVICVPGVFFDVDPGQRRLNRPSRFRHHVRFSFGPSEETIATALGRLRSLIERAR
ncbi:MAG: pyridoxal phosphate-dependent aminotransferase [Myxococcales bacterium]|nr:pyridoxal phosphate-dependent aminotransferase [Myxococcales bacterium]